MDPPAEQLRRLSVDRSLSSLPARRCDEGGREGKREWLPY